MHALGNIVLVGAGGFVGSVARYAVSLGVRALGWDGRWPLATLAVNVLGAILIGLLWGRVAHVPQPLGLLAIAGFCGGFTTFSAFSLETVQLLQAGNFGAGLLYAGASVVLCVGGVWLGMMLVR